MKIEILLLKFWINRYCKDDGIIPNSPLPVLVYRSVILFDKRKSVEENHKALEKAVLRNEWKVDWLWRIYRKTHYHSTAHECLVVFSGRAEIELGGHRVDYRERIGVGDVLIIPAGVAHRCVMSTENFSVFGLYPVGQTYDLLWGRKSDRKKALKNIVFVPRPIADPVFGKKGPLMHNW
jgi:uncharacterized protein YjlB